MKTCLVLEGGGLRGIYTAGVLDSLQKENIKIDAIIGVSMGALIGINYKSNQPGRALRYNLKYCNDKNYIGLYSLLKTGDVANKEFAYYKLPNELDPFDYDTYKKSKIKFICVVTDVIKGKAKYIEIKDAKTSIEYLRASSSMPGVSKIVKIKNKKYLDGGIADPIPIKKALELGYDKIIVVLTRPKEYLKKEKGFNPLTLIYHKYKKFNKTIKERGKKYNQTLKEIDNNKNIFVIRPSKKIKIKRIEKNPLIIKEQYDLGNNDFQNIKLELKKYLKDE